MRIALVVSRLMILHSDFLHRNLFILFSLAILRRALPCLQFLVFHGRNCVLKLFKVGRKHGGVHDTMCCKRDRPLKIGRKHGGVYEAITWCVITCIQPLQVGRKLGVTEALAGHPRLLHLYRRQSCRLQTHEVQGPIR